MRISDWSSDVCSSDLPGNDQGYQQRQQKNPGQAIAQLGCRACQVFAGNGGGDGPAQRLEVGRADFPRTLGVVAGELEGRYLAAWRNGMQQLAPRLSGFGLVQIGRPSCGERV